MNIAKIYEKNRCASIYNSLRSRLFPKQYDFNTRHSTITNVARISRKIDEGLDKQGQLGVIYTDLLQVFDTLDVYLDYQILLRKVSSLVFVPLVIKLSKSYLRGAMFFTTDFLSALEFLKGQTWVPFYSICL